MDDFSLSVDMSVRQSVSVRQRAESAFPVARKEVPVMSGGKFVRPRKEEHKKSLLFLFFLLSLSCSYCENCT